MARFKKGNKYTFKPGNIPYNKERTAKRNEQSECDNKKYTRLTKKKHRVVINTPYLDSEEKSNRALCSARLLCPRTKYEDVPKSKEKPVQIKR